MSRSIIALLLSLTALGLSACQGERLKESSSVGAEIRHLPEVAGSRSVPVGHFSAKF